MRKQCDQAQNWATACRWSVYGAPHGVAVIILGGNRMRKTASTGLCGARAAMRVPTATRIFPRHLLSEFEDYDDWQGEPSLPAGP